MVVARTVLTKYRRVIDPVSDARRLDVFALAGLMDRIPRSSSSALVSSILAERVDSILQSFATNAGTMRQLMRDFGVVLTGDCLCVALERGFTQDAIAFAEQASLPIELHIPHALYPNFVRAFKAVTVATHLGTLTATHDDWSTLQNHLVDPTVIRAQDIFYTNTINITLNSIDGECPLRLVGTSYASHRYNFLSADTLCIAYPGSIIRRETILREVASDAKRHEAQMQASEAGYTVLSDICRGWTPTGAVGHVAHGMCARKPRTFGDGHCLMMPVGSATAATNVTRLDFGGSEIDVKRCLSTSWILRGSACRSTRGADIVETSVAWDVNWHCSSLY